MAKGRSLNEKLARLRALRGESSSPQMLPELRRLLGDASNLVVAEAAALAGRVHATSLAPDLVAAFDRFLVNPVKSDKLCRAKIALAETLNQLEFDDEEFLWRGARYVQLEPAWGGSQDTAAPLRVVCAFALVRLRARGVQRFLVDLLSDAEKSGRVGAAQVLAYSETEAAGLLLRLKARLGDPETDVVAECFNGLLMLNAAEAIPFIGEFLEARHQTVREAAILASKSRSCLCDRMVLTHALLPTGPFFACPSCRRRT